MTVPAAPPLFLDHASVAVPGFIGAVAWFDERLGLRVTPSPAEPEKHGRIYLDRSYLEVSAREPAEDWRISLFFLRFNDPEALRQHLDSAGLDYTFGGYQGVDGTWDDVEVRAGDVTLPILVRRTHPPEVAKDWPPPLPEPHRCGALALDAVVVGVPALRPAVEVYRCLLGIVPDDVVELGGRVELPLASGRIILVEGELPGVDGIVLRVASLPDTLAVVGPAQQGGIALLDPATTHGIRLGFVQASSAE